MVKKKSRMNKKKVSVLEEITIVPVGRQVGKTYGEILAKFGLRKPAKLFFCVILIWGRSHEQVKARFGKLIVKDCLKCLICREYSLPFCRPLLWLLFTEVNKKKVCRYALRSLNFTFYLQYFRQWFSAAKQERETRAQDQDYFIGTWSWKVWVKKFVFLYFFVVSK